jgi:hypothetical protein
MFRRIAIVARLCRSPNIHSRLLSPCVVNSVRLKYQNRGGDKGAWKKGPANNDLDDAGESAMENDGAEYNLLDDK